MFRVFRVFTFLGSLLTMVLELCFVDSMIMVIELWLYGSLIVVIAV